MVNEGETELEVEICPMMPHYSNCIILGNEQIYQIHYNELFIVF